MHTIKHRRDLWKLFPDVTQCIAVELGVAEGLHSRDLCEQGYKLVISVDLWESHPDRRGDIASPQSWHNSNYNNVVTLLRPYGERSQILRGNTSTMAQHVQPSTVDLVYIDADHSYEGVKADIAAWWSRLKSGGIMAFHDYEMPEYGVKQAVTEWAATVGVNIYLLPEDAKKDAGAYLVKP
jgi:hypothetical protein